MDATTRPFPLMLAALMALSACSGDFEFGSPFDDGIAEADRLTDEATGAPLTDPDDLPTSGLARYNGVITMDTAFVDGERDGNADLVGDLRLDVDFDDASDPISGSATNFVSRTDQAYSGTLVVDNGVLDPTADPASGPVFGADLDGTLTAPGGNDYDLDGQMEGVFRGRDSGFIVGGAGGRACDELDRCTLFDGDFVGERQ